MYGNLSFSFIKVWWIPFPRLNFINKKSIIRKLVLISILNPICSKIATTFLIIFVFVIMDFWELWDLCFGLSLCFCFLSYFCHLLTKIENMYIPIMSGISVSSELLLSVKRHIRKNQLIQAVHSLRLKRARTGSIVRCLKCSWIGIPTKLSNFSPTSREACFLRGHYIGFNLSQTPTLWEW